MSSDERYQQLTDWLSGIYEKQTFTVNPLSGDAGFRRYFRVQFEHGSVLCVDAPPQKLNNLSFVELAKSFAKQGLIVPEILHYDEAVGFICISDFGDVLLSDKLSIHTMKSLYQEAIDLLPSVANVCATDKWQLPVYDAPFLQMEMDLFEQWFLNKHLDIWLTAEQKQQLQDCFELLVERALEQPQQCVHRDFHSRNLMQTVTGKIAVIDFQDAVIGPVTYDLVSLLRDCYVRWDDEDIEPLLYYAWQLLVVDKVNEKVDFTTFCGWFDFMGLQRHIKVVGIFSRLHYRDKKSNYLNDIPLTLSYIFDVAKKYPELRFLSDFIKQHVSPKMKTILSESNK